MFANKQTNKQTNKHIHFPLGEPQIIIMFIIY